MTIQFTTKSTQATAQNSATIIVFKSGKDLYPSTAELNEQYDKLISVSSTNLDAGAISSFDVLNKKTQKPQRLIVVQLGKASKRNGHELKSLRKIIGKVALKASKEKSSELLVCFDSLSVKEFDNKEKSVAWLTQSFTKALLKATYRYTTSKNVSLDALPKQHLKKVVFAQNDKAALKAAREGITEGIALGNGINACRELGNLPGNLCTPTDLATHAQNLAKKHEKLSAKILNQKAMERLKMGSLLSVARGSAEEPKLIILEYKGTSSKAPHVIVGKGITFDTGGISLKPGPGMDEMKFDMCGAASVLGTIQALAEMKAKVHVIGVVAAAENMPSSVATKPGDVVTSMSGQTIEVLNTDAEGRLVLCDALTYVERFKPKSVIDIATLTGACIIALGHHTNGLMANNQKLADAILKAASSSGDLTWQLPMFDEYQASLKSKFADIANIGGRDAGTITAACFLSRFTKKFAWAHLDIAGTAWKSGAQKGATGRPVELLVEYLRKHAI